MRNFDTEPRAPVKPREDRAFQMAGHVLHYTDAIPGEVMISLGKVDANSPVIADMGVITGLIFTLVEEDDHDALRAALAVRGELMVDLGMLGEVVGWIMEEATGRPLEQSAASGQSAATTSSTPSLTAPSRLQALDG